jgi:HK97 family phage major capsid protein
MPETTTGEQLDNTKVGARNSRMDQAALNAAHDALVMAGANCPAPADGEEGEMMEAEKTLVTFGAEVKALGDGKVGGYLIRYGNSKDVDLEGDFFTAGTEFGVIEGGVVPVFYQHGMDNTLKTRRIGRGVAKFDEVGLWLEAQLEMRDEYERAIYELAQAGKLGWSSGAAGHLVEREPMGKAYHIKSWPIAEGSLTPTPAEPRNTAVPLKSLYVSDAVADEIPAKDDGQAPVTENIVNNYYGPIYTVDAGTPSPAKEIKMADEIKGGEVAPEPKFDYELLADMVAKRLDVPGTAKSAPAVIKAENLGDPDPYRALAKWAGGGSAKGLGALGGKLINENAIHFDGKSTKAALQEASGEGAELVPDDFFPQIVAKRDQASIARRAGARVLQTSRDVINVPVENASMANFTITAEEAAYTENEPTFATVAITVYKATKVIKVSEELLEDDATNLDSFLTDGIGRAWALTENEYVVAGTGSSQPQGLLYGGSVGYTFADTNSITAAEIPALFWTLGDPYHDGAVWIMKGSTAGALQGLTGNNFQLVPTPYMPNQMVGDIPLNLWGKPVFLSDSMPAIADNNKTILLANMNYYALVERRGLTISRNPYLYQANGQVGIFCSVRFGGAVLQSEAVKWGVQV